MDVLNLAVEFSVRRHSGKLTVRVRLGQMFEGTNDHLIFVVVSYNQDVDCLTTLEVVNGVRIRCPTEVGRVDEYAFALVQQKDPVRLNS